MRLGISNIAWDVAYDARVADMLRLFRVDAIDVAPGKYFPQPQAATDAEISGVRSWWEQRGIEITGMQALLFGTSGLNVFGDAAAQLRLLAHFAAVFRIGAGLGAKWLVFGSPKNRDRGALNDGEALEVATEFFRRAGDLAAESGVFLCLEPNPVAYGANFMTTTPETAAVVRAVDHPHVRMQLDTGALLMNGEDAARQMSLHQELVGHLHLSEPDLAPIGDLSTNHPRQAGLLETYFSGRRLTIEMRQQGSGQESLDAVERALDCASRFYGKAASL